MVTLFSRRARFIIGDVKGKGLDAVGRCAAVLAVFRELAFGQPDLVGLATDMDARLASLSPECELSDIAGRAFPQCQWCCIDRRSGKQKWPPDEPLRPADTTVGAAQKQRDGGAHIMRLSSRFILDNLFLLAAAFLVVASMTWSAGVAGWIAFGVSAAITVIAGASAVLTTRGARKVGHGLIGLVALWSLVAALAFSGSLLTWLVFADALAVGVLALADLTAHEATTEKVVHQLVVHDGTTAEQRAAA